MSAAGGLTSALPWLLEPRDPGVRYLALRDLLGRPAGDAELEAARAAAHTQGPIAKILAAMDPGGFWVKPGPGYGPKYRSTVWSVMLLAQLGASPALDARITQGCEHLLTHALTPQGQFSYNGAPRGTLTCLQGNLLVALLALGSEPDRLAGAVEWMARSVTGEGVAPMSDRLTPLRYYAYTCGPGFACGANDHLPCAWGAVKVLLALAHWPRARWTPLIERAAQQGVDWLFGVDPVTADYPTRAGQEPSDKWWQFSFPVYYAADLLQLAEALSSLGYGRDPRLANTLANIRTQADPQGRWSLGYRCTGKTWGGFGAKGAPNKWVTLRALRTLQLAEG